MNLDILLEKIRDLEKRVEKLTAQTERAGEADSFPNKTSSSTPAYDGQTAYLTDLGILAYGKDGAWKKISDDTDV